MLPMGGKVFRRGSVVVRISDPIPTEGLTLKDREQVIATVRERIVGMLEG